MVDEQDIQDAENEGADPEENAGAPTPDSDPELGADGADDEADGELADYWQQRLGDAKEAVRAIEAITDPQVVTFVRDMEDNGKKRVTILRALRQREEALKPPEQEKKKQEPPLAWLDKAGDLHVRKDYQKLSGPVVYGKEGFVSVVLEAKNRSGIAKVKLSLLTGLPLPLDEPWD